MKPTSVAIVIAALFATPVAAQQAAAQPSVEEIVAQYYSETGHLRSALGQSQQQVIALKKQLEEVGAKLQAAEARVKELEAKNPKIAKDPANRN